MLFKKLLWIFTTSYKFHDVSRFGILFQVKTITKLVVSPGKVEYDKKLQITEKRSIIKPQWTYKPNSKPRQHCGQVLNGNARAGLKTGSDSISQNVNKLLFSNHWLKIPAKWKCLNYRNLTTINNDF